MSHTYPPIETLVPHGPVIRMLDRLEAWEPGVVHCTAHVRDDSPFVQDGKLNTLITLEHLAQTVATYLGYEAHLRGQPPATGMVVACRDYHIFRPALHVGEVLSIHASMTQGDIEHSQFSGEVFSGIECVASGTLTLVRGASLTAR